MLTINTFLKLCTKDNNNSEKKKHKPTNILVKIQIKTTPNNNPRFSSYKKGSVYCNITTNLSIAIKRSNIGKKTKKKKYCSVALCKLISYKLITSMSLSCTKSLNSKKKSIFIRSHV